MRYLLPHAVDRFAAEQPERPAVADRSRTLSYGELAAAANRLAHALLACGVGRQDRVLICLERGVRSIVAILGILKADAIYVPLPTKALTREQRIARDSEPRAIVCEQATLAEAVTLGADLAAPPALVLLDTGDRDVAAGRQMIDGPVTARLAATPLPCRNIDTDLAYILYTSGSTGSPKGVAISHLNVISYVDWAVKYFAIEPMDRILGTAPFHFDMSTFDVHATLQRGAVLHIASEQDLLFPTRLAEFVRQRRPTLWKGVASLLIYLANARIPESGAMASLTRIVFAGEKLPTRHLMHWMGSCPQARFYNAYGPTEATGISTCYAIPAIPRSSLEDIPIGTACANTEVLLLDGVGSVVAPGEVGEICLRGSGLSCGYWRDPARTAEVFTANPVGRAAGDRIYHTGDRAFAGADGNLTFVGRKDDQVKVMGHRVELDEVRRAVLALPGVNDADVLLVAGRASAELVAVVDLAPGLDMAQVARSLSGDLPAYMRPRIWVPLRPLPRTDRGKINRLALAQLLQERESAR